MQDVFTSESVSEGHPDKIADQISDGILDAFLKEDPDSRVACETFLARNLIFISGEITSKAHLDVIPIAREVIKKIGYDSSSKGLDYRTCSIVPLINNQSENIRDAVGNGKNQGAGDQGIMFGYAVNETEEKIPLSIHLAHQLVSNLALLRKQGHSFLWPDSKSQVTVRYEGGEAKDVSAIVVSTQHDPNYELGELRKFIDKELIQKTIPEAYLKNAKIYINPGGRFVIGGPFADCGLTGRKIVADTYGGHGAHGGGAFSGKDPSKVDRSASYIARHIAKNILAAGLAKKCLIQLSYAIGVAEPISLRVEHFNTSSHSREDLAKMILELWDLKPSGIIKELDLLKPRFSPSSCYGHFGRSESSFTWEKCNKVDKIKKWAKL